MCSLLVSWVFWVESWPNPTLHFKYGRCSEDPEEDQEKDDGDRQQQEDEVHDAQDPHLTQKQIQKESCFDWAVIPTKSNPILRYLWIKKIPASRNKQIQDVCSLKRSP